MKTNCNTFSFKDCCFLIQKDREGASRVIPFQFRSHYGNNWISLIAIPFRSPSVVLILENINSNISTSSIIDKWQRNSVNPSMISLIHSLQRCRRRLATYSKTFWRTTKTMMILAVMTLITRQYRRQVLTGGRARANNNQSQVQATTRWS